MRARFPESTPTTGRDHAIGSDPLARGEQNPWESVLAAGVKAQRLVPGAIAVGGAAASLYAKHRVSYDTDHLLPALTKEFDAVRERLERSPGWKTARVQPPVLILGSIDGVEVGFRQARRLDAIETTTIHTSSGPLTVPTLDELIGMKAYLSYARGAVRDYLDFAALASCTTDAAVLASLLKSDQRYGHLQSNSVALEIAKRLSEPRPYDLDEVDLSQYKGVVAQWGLWSRVEGVCRRFGDLLSRRLVLGEGT